MILVYWCYNKSTLNSANFYAISVFHPLITAVLNATVPNIWMCIKGIRQLITNEWEKSSSLASSTAQD
jgi:hypothetical protein